MSNRRLNVVLEKVKFVTSYRQNIAFQAYWICEIDDMI